MDLHGNPQIECGTFEQILTQFLLKSLNIILDSRVPSIRWYACQGEGKKSNKWFNLVLGDRPAALEDLYSWKRNLMEPMIIDIILVRETPNSSSDHNLHASLGLGTFTETIVERWVVEYEHLRKMSPQTGDASDQKVYKESIILLRSLYSMMRLLPAYKAFQKLSCLSQAIDFDIMYKVSVFSAPFSRAEEDLMRKYSFVPVDALQGRLAISVTYRKSLSDFNLKTFASIPSKIITDYAGSPLTDPLRVFPYSLEKGFCVTSLSLRGMHSPSSTSFLCPHSLTSGGYPVQTCSRSETSPVSIPHPVMSRNSRYLSPNLLDPNRHSLPPLSHRFTKHDLSSLESPAGMRSLGKPESIESEESSYGITNLGQKVSRGAKIDSGRFSGLLSSSGSPLVGFSRSSRRSSFQDDLDEGDFSCPFIGDDVDIAESQPSQNLGGRKVSEVSLQVLPMARKSQDSDVAVLFHKLRTAPPLGQESSSYAFCSSNFELEGDGGTSSRFFMPLKTSDALEELKAYKEMEELLLSIRASEASRKGKASSN